MRYTVVMATRSNATTDDKLRGDGGAKDVGYDAWKRAKIERALTQADDRGSMIAADDVWRDLGLER